MTMEFKLPVTVAPKGIAVGDTVSFEILQTRDGSFEITSIASSQQNTAVPAISNKGPITKAPASATAGSKP
jgi:hypothetical protein